MSASKLTKSICQIIDRYYNVPSTTNMYSFFHLDWKLYEQNKLQLNHFVARPEELETLQNLRTSIKDNRFSLHVYRNLSDEIKLRYRESSLIDKYRHKLHKRLWVTNLTHLVRQTGHQNPHMIEEAVVVSNDNVSQTAKSLHDLFVEECSDFIKMEARMRLEASNKDDIASKDRLDSRIKNVADLAALLYYYDNVNYYKNMSNDRENAYMVAIKDFSVLRPGDQILWFYTKKAEELKSMHAESFQKYASYKSKYTKFNRTFSEYLRQYGQIHTCYAIDKSFLGHANKCTPNNKLVSHKEWESLSEADRLSLSDSIRKERLDKLSTYWDLHGQITKYLKIRYLKNKKTDYIPDELKVVAGLV